MEAIKDVVRRQCLAAGGGEGICEKAVRIVEDAVERKYIEKTASNGTRVAVRWAGDYDFAALTIAKRESDGRRVAVLGLESDGRRVAVLGLGGGGLPPLVIVILDDGAIEEMQVLAKEYFNALDPHPDAIIKLLRRGVPPGFGE
jgi:hypothetical protein